VDFKLLEIILMCAVLYGLLLVGLQRGWRFSFAFANPETKSIEGERIVLRVARTKHGAPVSLLMEFAVPSSWRFCVRAENWFDRLGKALRLVREPEIGDADFDQRFFLEIDCPAFLQLLDAQHQLRHRLGALAIQIAASSARLQRIECSAGQLSVVVVLPWSMRFGQDESGVSTQLDELAALAQRWLAPLLSALRAQPPNCVQGEVPGVRVMQIVLTSIPVAVLLNWSIAWKNPMLDIWLLRDWMLAFGGLIWISLLAVIAWHCRRSMKRHYTLLVCGLFLMPMTGIIGFHAARLLNVALAQPQRVLVAAELSNISERAERTPFGPNTYRVSFNLLEAHPLIGESRWFYLQLDANVVAILKQHIAASASTDADVVADADASYPIVSLRLYPGALGAPWIKL